MKKKILFAFIIFLSFFTCCYTLEKDEYVIDIPEIYKSEKSDDGELFSYKNNNQTTSVLIYTKSNKNKLNISNYTNEDVVELTEPYKKQILDSYKASKIDAEIKKTDASIIKLNSYDLILMSFETEYTFNNKKSVVYQNQYMATSNKYIYYIVISSTSKDIIDGEETQNMLKSFKIKDDLIKEKTFEQKVKKVVKDNLVLYIISLVVIIFTFCLMIFTRNKKVKNS